ncbi:hypothetical protein P3S67_001198 [Capsicum chacoense]
MINLHFFFLESGVEQSCSARYKKILAMLYGYGYRQARTNYAKIQKQTIRNAEISLFVQMQHRSIVTALNITIRLYQGRHGDS